MVWSPSAAKIFASCPRKWFYGNVLANARASDEIRKEAYLLKQLQSVYAWRGSLVDNVITKIIVPRLNLGVIPRKDDVISYALNLAEQQIEFGRKCSHRNPNTKRSLTGDAYCAFFDVEYNGGLEEKDILQAKEEINCSLSNLLESDLIKYLIEHKASLLAQRSLTYKFDDATIKCTPDVIAFFTSETPLIIDWKVHTFATYDYRLQLSLYAIALSKAKAQTGFPTGFTVPAKEVRLIEYQLLKNVSRNYELTDEDINDVDDYIYQSLLKIETACNGHDRKAMIPVQFESAYNPRTCVSCQFKKLCWEMEVCDRKGQMSLPGVLS